MHGLKSDIRGTASEEMQRVMELLIGESICTYEYMSKI